MTLPLPYPLIPGWLLRSGAIAMALVSVAGAPLAGQMGRPVGPARADSIAEVDTTRTLCFRSRPLPRCRVYPVFDFGGLARLNGSGGGSVGYLVTGAAGLEVNVGRRHAVGIAATFGANDGETWGIAARYRRWLSRDITLDIDAGTPLGGVRSFSGSPRADIVVPSLSLGAELGLWHWVGITSRLEVMRYCDFSGCDEPSTDVGAYFGLQVHGAVAAGVVGMVFVAILAAVSGG